MVYDVAKQMIDGIYYNTPYEVMSYISMQYFNNTKHNTGSAFLIDFGEYLDKTKFPCNRIVVDCKPSGYENCFILNLDYYSERVAKLRLKVKSYGRICIDYCTYYKSDFKCFDYILLRFFNKRNWEIFSKIGIKWIEKYGIKTDSTNEVYIQKCSDYQSTGEMTLLKGTITEIFDTYIDMNDRLRYCGDGNYYKFDNKKINELYQIYMGGYKNNIFLDYIE